ncbi:MAG: hypothetical protein WD398_05565 [Cyclobacteriaceae bacterium]
MTTKLFKEDSTVLLEILKKFKSGDSKFPFKELKGFLDGVEESIKHLRGQVFIETENDTVFVFKSDIQIGNFPNLEQKYFALQVLSDCIFDIGNELYEHIKVKDPNDENAYAYLHSFHETINKERFRIKEEIQLNELIFSIKKDHNFEKLMDELASVKVKTLDQKITLVNEFIIDLESNPDAVKYLYKDLANAKGQLSDLYLELSSESERKFHAINEKLESIGQEPGSLSVAAKVIIMHQLGIIECLQTYPKFKIPHALADLLSNLIGGTKGNIQPYLNPLKNEDFDNEKSPYSTPKAVSDAKLILEKYHIQYKEF